MFGILGKITSDAIDLVKDMFRDKISERAEQYNMDKCRLEAQTKITLAEIDSNNKLKRQLILSETEITLKCMERDFERDIRDLEIRRDIKISEIASSVEKYRIDTQSKTEITVAQVNGKVSIIKDMINLGFNVEQVTSMMNNLSLSPEQDTPKLLN